VEYIAACFQGGTYAEAVSGDHHGVEIEEVGSERLLWIFRDLEFMRVIPTKCFSDTQVVFAEK